MSSCFLINLKWMENPRGEISPPTVGLVILDSALAEVAALGLRQDASWIQYSELSVLGHSAP